MFMERVEINQFMIMLTEPSPFNNPRFCLKTKLWVGPTACGARQSCLHQDLNKPHDANFCNPPCIYVHYLVLQFYNFKVCDNVFGIQA